MQNIQTTDKCVDQCLGVPFTDQLAIVQETHAIECTHNTYTILLATAMSLSSKMLEDRPVHGCARCSGLILTKYFYNMEAEFTQCVDYKLLVTVAEYNKWYDYDIALGDEVKIAIYINAINI